MPYIDPYMNEMSDANLEDEKKRMAMLLASSNSQPVQPAQPAQPIEAVQAEPTDRLKKIMELRKQYDPTFQSQPELPMEEGLSQISSVMGKSPEVSKNSALSSALLAAIPGIFGSLAGGKEGGGIGFTAGGKAVTDQAKIDEDKRKEASKLESEKKKVMSGYIKDYLLLPIKERLALKRALELASANGVISATNALIKLDAEEKSKGKEQEFKAGESDEDRAIRIKSAEETERHNRAMEANAAKKVDAVKAEKKPTIGELKTASYAKDMERAEQIMQSISADYDASSLSNRIQNTQPFDYFRTDDQKKMKVAESMFVNAVARPQSGAVIGPQELESYAARYFPRSGDSEDVIAQKAESRRQILEQTIAESGPAYKKMPVKQEQKQSDKKPVYTAKSGKQYSEGDKVTIGGRLYQVSGGKMKAVK